MDIHLQPVSSIGAVVVLIFAMKIALGGGLQLQKVRSTNSGIINMSSRAKDGKSMSSNMGLNTRR